MTNNRVFCIGVWDLFHCGHLNFLYECKQYGYILDVGIVKDEAVNRYKGKNRPIIHEIMRYEIIKSIKIVNNQFYITDFIIKNNIIQKYDIICIGKDQHHIKGRENIPTTKIRIINRYPYISTSKIIDKIKNDNI